MKLWMRVKMQWYGITGACMAWLAFFISGIHDKVAWSSVYRMGEADRLKDNIRAKVEGE